MTPSESSCERSGQNTSARAWPGAVHKKGVKPTTPLIRLPVVMVMVVVVVVVVVGVAVSGVR